MKKLLFFLLCFAVSFSWELKKEENGIKVYTSPVKGSKYVQMKAVAVLPADVYENVKKVVLTYKDYPSWQKKVKEIKSENGYLLKVFDFPFPFSDRYAFYKISVNEKGGVFKAEYKSVPYDKLPENIKKRFKKPSGVEMKDDVTFLVKRVKNETEVVYKAKVDPKGVPAFVFNSKIVTAGYETLNNLKNAAVK
ncbi:hypothetical protein [Nautilia sp.]